MGYDVITLIKNLRLVMAESVMMDLKVAMHRAECVGDRVMKNMEKSHGYKKD